MKKTIMLSSILISSSIVLSMMLFLIGADYYFPSVFEALIGILLLSSLFLWVCTIFYLLVILFNELVKEANERLKKQK